MTRVNQPAEFFVVGGPVQPNRPCYLGRRTDAELLQGIADQQFCYVLSPRATGKSSLMAATISSLRGEGQLAAVVDLTQIASRGESDDAGRWYYSIAYRILRELRIKADLQSWWQDKSALYSEQRLVEFFWEIVLTETKAPVTIFLDEIERAANLPFAEKLFAAIRTCYARRVSEPNFERLNFVVLGVSTPAQLCPNESLSPFVDGRAFRLPDFTVEECLPLAAGFDCDIELGQKLIRSIHSWTRGHPYLTQKLARAVARKEAQPAEVDSVVDEQFLAPGVSQGEPLLAYIRNRMTEDTPIARQALALLVKIVRGRDVSRSLFSASRDYLLLSGIVSRDSGDRLRMRNEIFRQVFDSTWVNSVNRGTRRRNLSVAAAVAGVALIVFWYSQILPRPYIDTLTVVTNDYALAEDAYQSLRGLPGFAGTADRLLAEAMSRRSRQTDAFEEVMAADSVLRQQLNRSDLADELLGAHWLERSAEAAASERRDAAIVYAAQALAFSPTASSAVVAELLGGDYPKLLSSIRLAETPSRWQVDWQRGELVVVDPGHRADRIAFARDAPAEARRVADRLTALQHIPVSRELTVDENGEAGLFELLLTLDHGKTGDLLVTLTGPSGQQAMLTLPDSDSEGRDGLVFSAGEHAALAELVSEQRRGVWRLRIVDRRSEEVGSLLGWGLRFAGSEAVIRDEPEQGMALPDPARSDEVEVEISADGRVAISWSARAEIAGSLAVWDLIDGTIVGDLPLAEMSTSVAYSAAAGRAIVTGSEALTIWDIGRAQPVASHATIDGSSVGPAVSVDGGFVAVAERGPLGGLQFGLLRVDDGARLSSIEGVAGFRDWLLGPRAAYLAILTPARQVRLVNPLSGQLIANLTHRREIERMIAFSDAALLLTVDSGGEIHAWQLPLPDSGVERVSGTLVGVTADAASVGTSADARAVAFLSAQGHIELRRIKGDYGPQQFRLETALGELRTRISPDGAQLLTANGPIFRIWKSDEWPAGSNADLEVSALAVDRGGSLAILGYRDGHLTARNVTDLARAPLESPQVNYIGHRGAIVDLAVNGNRGTAVSGGEDGVVRVWNLAGAIPREFFLRHPVAPVMDVDISDDGTLVASAAEYSARIWAAADGQLVGEIPANGAAVAVEFAPGSGMLAVGDSAGNLFFGSPRGADPWLSARTQAALSAIAFAPDAKLIASGDAGGRLQLWDATTAEPVGTPQDFNSPISAVEFTADGLHLLVRSGHWLHKLSLADGELTIDRARPVAGGLEAAALTGSFGSETYLRVVGGVGDGSVTAYDLRLDADSGPAVADAQFARDWPVVLDLRIDPGTGDLSTLR